MRILVNIWSSLPPSLWVIVLSNVGTIFQVERIC